MFQRLKVLSAKIVEVQSFILLAVVYLLFIPLISLFDRRREFQTNTGWHRWNYTVTSIDDLRLA